jgi:hypothetical protein
MGFLDVPVHIMAPIGTGAIKVSPAGSYPKSAAARSASATAMDVQ